MTTEFYEKRTPSLAPLINCGEDYAGGGHMLVIGDPDWITVPPEAATLVGQEPGPRRVVESFVAPIPGAGPGRYHILDGAVSVIEDPTSGKFLWIRTPGQPVDPPAAGGADATPGPA